MGDMEETFKDAEKWQWMANKEGGQTYGNQMVIAKITPELYEKYVRKLTEGNPIYATALKKGYVTPDTGVQLTRYENAGEWKLTKVDDIYKLRPSGEATKWAKRVQDFEHPEATEWGQKSDSDVYPVRATHPEMTKAGIDSLSKRVAATLSGKMDATSIPINLLDNQQARTGKVHPILMQWADGKLWERFRKAGGMKEYMIDHPEYGKVMVFGNTQAAVDKLVGELEGKGEPKLSVEEMV
jgi:hypothetical protein